MELAVAGVVAAAVAIAVPTIAAVVVPAVELRRQSVGLDLEELS